ncbi:hypothetical protein ABZ848_48110 [Streptomyces sp. NPDC047081]|uniref:hypothetical protein n=1 Tax=Streptomyces sp. NPDC047081 TaxID=3154706 RepID=UPI0033C4EE8B
MPTALQLPCTVSALALATALTAATSASPPAHTTTATSARAAAYYRQTGTSVRVEDTRTYTLTLRSTPAAKWAVDDGTDVTSWFVDADGDAAFIRSGGAALATRTGTRLTVRLDASRIAGFTRNGSSDLYVRPPATALHATAGHTAYAPAATEVGSYVIPRLRVSSDITGSAYTYGKSTLKEQFGGVVGFDPGTAADLSLDLPGLDDGDIGGHPRVELTDGDGYFPSEYTLKATRLKDAWTNGRNSYSLHQGDLVLDTGDYPITDKNSGREWSCLGGDGQGDYTFNLTVTGITYNGLPVAARTFRVHVSIYGYDYTSDAEVLYGSGTTVRPDFAPLRDKVADPPEPAARPVWTWVGAGTEPNLTDAEADDFYVTWPRGVNASALRSSDIKLVLHSRKGDTRTLRADQDYALHTSSTESQIAVTLRNWAFEPVYTSLTLTVNPAHVKGTEPTAAFTKAYDIASVYAYEAQQGGGGTAVDGTVTAYSFYGLTDLTSATQVLSPVTYTLSTTVDGRTRYYAEDARGEGRLVDAVADAKAFDGTGAGDRDVRLIGNTVYLTTRLNRTATATVDGETLTFAKTYGGGTLLGPAAADRTLRAAPGYAIDQGAANWISHEKWAWQSSVATGWTGIDIRPYTGKFEWSVAKGTTQQFTADDPSVAWSISGAKVAAGTSISPTGLLTVAPDESTTTFAVVATSTNDSSPQGKGTVNVTVTAP